MIRLSAPKGRSAMAVIAGCFLFSAVLRIVDPSSAVAVEVSNLKNASLTSDNDESQRSPARAATAYVNPDLAELLAALHEREAQLGEKATRLAEREQIIRVSEKRLRDQLKQLEDAEKRLADTLRIADRAADKDVERLVLAFEAMDAKKAAPIFESMDIAFASGLISRMKGKAAADVLGSITAEKAYAISVFMVGQNARAPTN